MRLPEPFFVLATQNPIEQEGTYPLPEAQLDRFLFDIRIGYPTADEEIAILRATTGADRVDLKPVLDAEHTLALQRLTREVPAAEPALRYAASLVRATRPDAPDAPELVRRYVRWGAGPRAGQSLILGAKAHALLGGRVGRGAGGHPARRASRCCAIACSPTSPRRRRGSASERIIDEILERVPPPRSDIRI